MSDTPSSSPMGDIPSETRQRPAESRGRYCVVIPALNAEQSLGALIPRIRAQGLDVLVVDDGSTDRTAAAAAAQGALVISHLTNKGKGRALRSAFDYARRAGYDGVITMDGDGQHDPAEIPQFIQAAEQEGAALVLGNRMSGGTVMPRARRRTNLLMSDIVSAVARQPIPDSQCGYRLIRREVLEAVALRARRYEIETEIVLKVAARRWKIISVPIRSIYDSHQSYIQPIREGIRFVGLVFHHLVFRR